MFVSDNPEWEDINLSSSYPHRSIVSEKTVETGRLQGVTDAEVETLTGELTLGLDWTRRLFGRLDVYALAGVTLQVLDWELGHTTRWTVAGQAEPAAVTRDRDTGTKLLAGAVGELGLRLRLDAAGRYFIEAGAEYLHMENTTLRAGSLSVKQESRSWGGKAGIGMTL